MVKRGKSWFRAVKRVFSPESKEKKAQNLKKSDSERPVHSDLLSSEVLQSNASDLAPHPPPPALSVSISEERKFTEPEHEQFKHVYPVANPASTINFTDKSREEAAAIKIQTNFRGYLARRALRALRGLVRLKSLLQGNAVKRQTATTLRCMQTLARVQSHIRSRRMRMIEENQCLQRQLLLKSERELENLRMDEEWDDSIQSKEQIEAGFLNKQEAYVRRERALAYAFSHQWKTSSKSSNPTFVDPTNPHWGWSWLERWTAARPWESRSISIDKELNNDRAFIKSSNGIEIAKSYARRGTSFDETGTTPQKASRPPPSRPSPGTPRSKALPVSAGKIKSASPKRSNCTHLDDDTRSTVSTQSERPRRHSIAVASIRDDVSLTSSPAVPSYMAPTRSARAKNRIPSPHTDSKIQPAPENDPSPGSVKKKLSFPNPSGPARRHSGPPRLDGMAVVQAIVISEQNEASEEQSR